MGQRGLGRGQEKRALPEGYCPQKGSSNLVVMLILLIAIYPVDSAIQLSNNCMGADVYFWHLAI